MPIDPISLGAKALGGAMGGKGSDTKDVTQKSAPWEAQQPYLKNLFSQADTWLNSGGPQYFGGQTYAGFDPAQQQAQQSAMGYAGNQLPGMINQTQSGLGQMLSATPNMDVWNPVMEAAMRQPIQAFQEQVLPSIRTGAADTGQYGSSRQGIAEGLAAGRLGQSLADTQANLSQAAASEALNQRKVGMAMAPQVMGLGLMPSSIMEQVGAQRQGMEQQGINEAMNRWNFGQNAPLANLQAYQGLIGGGGYGGTQTNQVYGNPAMGALGGAIGMNQLSQGKGGKGDGGWGSAPGGMTSPGGMYVDLGL